MAKDFISLGDAAARGVAMFEIRCGRCDRHGRLLVRRLLVCAPSSRDRSVNARSGIMRRYTTAAIAGRLRTSSVRPSRGESVA